MMIKYNIFIKGEVDSIDISIFFFMNTITGILIHIPNMVASEAATGI